MKIILIYFIAILSACSSQTVIPTANGKFVATYSDRSVGANGTSVTSKVMELAKIKCNPREVKVISISSTGMAIGTFPEALLTFECI